MNNPSWFTKAVKDVVREKLKRFRKFDSGMKPEPNRWNLALRKYAAGRTWNTDPGEMYRCGTGCREARKKLLRATSVRRGQWA
jgi:hypothetical protein